MKTTQAFASVYDDGRMVIDTACKSQQDAFTQGASKVIKVEIKDATKRSMSANGLFHVWCKFLKNHSSMGYSEHEIKQVLKLKFGLPILMHDEARASRINYVLEKCGYQKMTYSQKIKLIELISVTSIMTTEEMREFMNCIKDWAASELQLALPEKEYAEH